MRRYSILVVAAVDDKETDDVIDSEDLAIALREQLQSDAYGVKVEALMVVSDERIFTEVLPK